MGLPLRDLTNEPLAPCRTFRGRVLQWAVDKFRNLISDCVREDGDFRSTSHRFHASGS